MIAKYTLDLGLVIADSLAKFLKGNNMRVYWLVLLSLCLVACVNNRKDMSKMSLDYISHVKSLKSAQINGQTLKYIDQGEGEVFLLVHGIPTNSWMYRKIIKGLSQKYRVIAPDLIGFGQSSKPKKGFHVKEQAQVLKTLLREHIRVRDINIMIHDFGGIIGLMAVKLGDFKVNKAVILNTFVYDKGWRNGYDLLNKTANSVLPEMMTRTFFTSGVKSMFASKMSKDTIEGYVRPLEDRNGTAGYSCLYLSIPDIKKRVLPAAQKTFAKVLNPKKTKIIWGQQDVFLDSVDQVGELSRALKIPPKSILVLKNGKHLIADENAKEILNFIE